AIHLIGRKKRRLPDNVLLCLATPGDRQVYLVGLSHAGGAAPAGPVLARVCGGGDDGNDIGGKKPSYCHDAPNPHPFLGLALARRPASAKRKPDHWCLSRYALHSCRIALVALAPTRVTPMARTASRRSKVRTPPAAFTRTCGGEQRRISFRSSSVAPAVPYPVDVLTKSARTSPQIWHSFSLCLSCRKQFSKTTLTTTFCECAFSTTARMSSLTKRQSSLNTLPILTTMSSSVAPSSVAWIDSATLSEVACPPCGKPIVVPTATVEPARILLARATAYGLMQTEATSQSRASWQP